MLLHLTSYHTLSNKRLRSARSRINGTIILYNRAMRSYIPPWTKSIPQSAKKVFSGIIYDVYQWPQQLFDGSFTTFEMLQRPDTTIVIAILTEQEIKILQENNSSGITPITFSNSPGPQLVIASQEQPSKGIFYSFPGGRVDPADADELTGAKRELLEETGLTFQNWKLIKVKQPLNKIDWLVYTFVAIGLIHQQAQQLDAGERISIRTVNFQEAQELSQLPEGKYLETDFSNLDQLLITKPLHSYT